MSLRTISVMALCFCATSAGVSGAQDPLLDLPLTVFRWKAAPSHESPMIELQLRHTDEIALTVIHPEPPLLVSERACGKPNLFYSAAEQTIILCREMGPFVKSLNQELQGQGPSNRSIAPADTGFLVFLILHEAGHALVHQTGFPVIGGTEEAADGFATWMLLHRRVSTAKPWFADDSTANALRVMDAAVMLSQCRFEPIVRAAVSEQRKISSTSIRCLVSGRSAFGAT
jgi:hypothetical protein